MQEPWNQVSGGLSEVAPLLFSKRIIPDSSE